MRRFIDALALLACVAGLALSVYSFRSDRDYQAERARWYEWAFDQEREIRYEKEGADEMRFLARQTLGKAQAQWESSQHESVDSGFVERVAARKKAAKRKKSYGR